MRLWRGKVDCEESGWEVRLVGGMLTRSADDRERATKSRIVYHGDAEAMIEDSTANGKALVSAEGETDRGSKLLPCVAFGVDSCCLCEFVGELNTQQIYALAKTRNKGPQMPSLSP